MRGISITNYFFQNYLIDSFYHHVQFNKHEIDDYAIVKVSRSHL